MQRDLPTSAGTPEPATDGMEDHVEGSLERVVFQNPDNAWSVVRLRVEGEREPVTAVGSLAGIQPGERLRLAGAWVTDPKFGRQFQVVTYRTLQPSTVEGIEKYLASGMLKGIGPEMAKRLVAAFGADTLEVIESSPERLREVPGIGEKRSRDIASGFAGQRQLREVMVFLQSHGVAAHLAVKIARRYGDDALGLVRTDPYRLARDVAGIGFATADEIAFRLGISRDAPERVRAAVLHLLGEAASNGHVFLPEGELVRQTVELLGDGSPGAAPGVGTEAVEEAIRHLAGEGAVVVESHDDTADGRAVFSGPLHEAETTLARRLRELVEHPVRPIEIDALRAVQWFEEREGIELAAEQRSAVAQATSAKVLVVTGGPGTGKTTLVRGIVEILRLKGRRIRLAAPTGRAAKRLSEATGQGATTLHRLLEFDPKTGGFVRDREHPVEADLVIVDEASMVDTPLAASLVEALPDAAQLVLVGDIDQLPSVGPGSVLSDAIRSGAVAVVRLEAIFRQAQESLIVGNAHRVNRGEMPVSAGDDDPRRDFFFIERSSPERVLDALVEVVVRRIPQSFGLDPFEDLQVLSPMNRGLLGVHQLNRTLRDLLNPLPAGGGGREITRGSRSFRVGDKVMQTRNNYELDVFNGDLGRITALHEDAEEITVRFDGREIAYPFADLDELSLAYACSIHKSQGSEYPAVVVPLHTQHFVMLERNLLYTALTRARRLVVLVGDPRALAIAVRNRKNRSRHTRLAERLAAPA